MGLREDIREDTAKIVAMAVHAKEKEYVAIQDNVTNCIVRLDRIEAKLNDTRTDKLSGKSALGLMFGHIWRKRKIEAIEHMMEMTDCSKRECETFVEYWDKKFNQDRDDS